MPKLHKCMLYVCLHWQTMTEIVICLVYTCTDVRLRFTELHGFHLLVFTCQMFTKLKSDVQVAVVDRLVIVCTHLASTRITVVKLYAFFCQQCV